MCNCCKFYNYYSNSNYQQRPDKLIVRLPQMRGLQKLKSKLTWISAIVHFVGPCTYILLACLLNMFNKPFPASSQTNLAFLFKSLHASLQAKWVFSTSGSAALHASLYGPCKTVYNKSDLNTGGGNSQNGGYSRHCLCYSRFRWIIEIVMCSLPYIEFE